MLIALFATIGVFALVVVVALGFKWLRDNVSFSKRQRKVR